MRFLLVFYFCFFSFSFPVLAAIQPGVYNLPSTTLTELRFGSQSSSDYCYSDSRGCGGRSDFDQPIYWYRQYIQGGFDVRPVTSYKVQQLLNKYSDGSINSQGTNTIDENYLYLYLHNAPRGVNSDFRLTGSYIAQENYVLDPNTIFEASLVVNNKTIYYAELDPEPQPEAEQPEPQPNSTPDQCSDIICRCIQTLREAIDSLRQSIDRQQTPSPEPQPTPTPTLPPVNPVPYERKNILQCSLSTLTNKFPLDIIAFSSVPGGNSGCPGLNLFGERIEACFVRDIFHMAEVPALIWLIIQVLINL